uniref:Dickkopf-related protein 3-like n=1 Tax=Hippocampus comes TaxID=109280 RepID=A0A3Q2Z2Q1_HIPCM
IKFDCKAEMSGHVFLSVTFSLFLLWGAVGVVPSRAMIIRDGQEQSFVSLDDMFREVEELMEDTQNLLEDAVDQVEYSIINVPKHLFFLSSPSGYFSAKAVYVLKKLHRHSQSSNAKLTCNAMLIRNVYLMPQECLVDEDCGERKYCLYRIDSSKCLPCIPTDMPCTKNEECCSSQLCVWGQCTVNTTEGTEGTICQGQNDCKRDLCCAFQRELLFPVCNPKPGQGEACLNQPNLLMDMLAWDQEGPRDYCPCANDLQCQPQGCLKCKNRVFFLRPHAFASLVDHTTRTFMSLAISKPL